MADGGEFVCVLNNPIAMLDLPVVSAGAIEDRLFEANLEKLPPPGTPVTIVLTPKVSQSRREVTVRPNEEVICRTYFSSRVTLSSSRSMAKGLRM